MGKIKIHMAEEAGFCFGVKNAIKHALEEAQAGDRVFTLGDLVHNQNVMNSLELQGISSVSLEDAFTGTVLIRAHGVTGKVKQEVKARATKMVDATCPMVKTIKKQVDESYNNGALVILFGHEKHPEAIGIKDDREDVVVISDAQDLEHEELKKRITTAKAVSLFSQSTMFVEGFHNIEACLFKIRPDAFIKNTICSPTRKRQTSVVELAKRLPLIIVVGDEKSANTNHLLELALKHTSAKRVLNASELDPKWFDDIHEVGVTAGASTPDEAINEVINKIESFQ